MASNVEVELKAILSDYVDEIQEVANKAITSGTKEAAKKLKSDSPKEEGDYSKGWTTRIDKSHGAVTGTAYNKTKPGLTHLLENGHAKVNGGRVSAKPHILPVQEWATAEIMKEIEAAL